MRGGVFSPAVLRAISLAMAVVFAVVSSGCAAIFKGTSENVMVITHPKGRTVYYEGFPVEDGEQVRIHKRFKEPQMNIGTEDRPYFVGMDYGPDAWLIGDGVLLVFFIIPGLIAFGVDFGSGAWRNLESPQRLHVGLADRYGEGAIPREKEAGTADDLADAHEHE